MKALSNVKNFFTTTLLFTFPFLLMAQPTITSFNPTSGSIGTLVTITGSNLTIPINLTIGGVAATAISNTGNSLVAMVMPNTPTGTVSITTSGGSATSNADFTVVGSNVPNTQQGNKLIGTSSGVISGQGSSVSLSADGNTAIVGAPATSGGGAAFIYARIGSTWSQQ